MGSCLSTFKGWEKDNHEFWGLEEVNIKWIVFINSWIVSDTQCSLNKINSTKITLIYCIHLPFHFIFLPVCFSLHSPLIFLLYIKVLLIMKWLSTYISSDIIYYYAEMWLESFTAKSPVCLCWWSQTLTFSFWNSLKLVFSLYHSTETVCFQR